MLQHVMVHFNIYSPIGGVSFLQAGNICLQTITVVSIIITSTLMINKETEWMEQHVSQWKSIGAYSACIAIYIADCECLPKMGMTSSW